MKQESQSETIAELNARCEGPDQFERFDRAFRASLTVPKATLLKKEATQKQRREKKLAQKKSAD